MSDEQSPDKARHDDGSEALQEEPLRDEVLCNDLLPDENPPGAGSEQGIGRIDLTRPPPPLKRIVEGALMAAGRPLKPEQILALFPESQRPQPQALLACLQSLSEELIDRGVELVQVAGGWRMQATREVAPWVGRLWQEKPPRYSRALLETLALIAYRQPITRGEIEEIRGVAVSTQIVKTLSERDWIRIIGHREVPGRPALYATTRQFLEHFGLNSLNELPPLSELRDPAFFDQFLPPEGSKERQGVQVERPADTASSPETSDIADSPAVSVQNHDNGSATISEMAPEHQQDDAHAKRLH